MITIAKNPSAFKDYAIIDTVEAGLMLKGDEIKSLRQSKANIKDSFARIDDGEIFLYNMHIAPYEQAAEVVRNPTRVRKLLLHRVQIDKLIGQVSQKGLVLVPLRLYFKKGIAKIELAVAKGRRLYDRREAIKRHEIQREIYRAIKSRQ